MKRHPKGSDDIKPSKLWQYIGDINGTDTARGFKKTKLSSTESRISLGIKKHIWDHGMQDNPEPLLIQRIVGYKAKHSLDYVFLQQSVCLLYLGWSTQFTG